MEKLNLIEDIAKKIGSISLGKREFLDINKIKYYESSTSFGEGLNGTYFTIGFDGFDIVHGSYTEKLTVSADLDRVAEFNFDEWIKGVKHELDLFIQSGIVFVGGVHFSKKEEVKNDPD